MPDPTTIAARFAASYEKRLNDIRAKNSSTPSVNDIDTASALNATTPTPIVDMMLAAAEETAALCGDFHPDLLFSPNESQAAREIVLSRLAPSCVVRTEGLEIRWFLLRRFRRIAIARLLAQKRLSRLLESSLPVTDRLGDILREVLKNGAAASLKNRSQDDLLAIITVIELLDGLDLTLPDVAAVRLQVKYRSAYTDYISTLPVHFFGRRAELKKLHDFVAAQQYFWQGLVLTGLGGAGKSALLAKFSKHLTEKKSATVVILDFDRPGISADDTYWLETEISRQIGQQYPQIATALHDIRHRFRETRDVGKIEQFSSESITDDRSSRHQLAEIRTWMESISVSPIIGARPFLLILDTFEEVMQQNLTPHILNWIAEIADYIPLHVIISGRLYDNAQQNLIRPEIFTRSEIVEFIEVSELDRNQARHLLIGQGITTEAAKRLIALKLLPRRPLELKLLAQALNQSPSETIDELEAELRTNGPQAKTLFGGIVYRRVLQRIQNDNARMLAYPGLVLRYITRELIQQVLVPVLELSPLNDGQALEALNALAAHGWLAYRGENDEVWHRKDLRRSMLRLMIVEDPEKAGKIHNAAIAYYTDKQTDRDVAEIIYHQLMLADTPAKTAQIDIDSIKKVKGNIGGDFEDLPLAAAILFKFITNRNLELDELELLPENHYPRACRETGQRLVNAREFGNALKLIQAMRRRVAAEDIYSKNNIDWVRETEYATATWDTGLSMYFAATAPPLPIRRSIDDLFTLMTVTGQYTQLPYGHLSYLSALRDAMAMAQSLSDTTMQRSFICALLIGLPDALDTASRLGYLGLATSRRPLTNLRLRQTDEALGIVRPVDIPTWVAPPTVRLDFDWLTELADAVKIERSPINTAQQESYETLVANIVGRHLSAAYSNPTTTRKLLSAVDSALTELQALNSQSSVNGREEARKSTDPAGQSFVQESPKLDELISGNPLRYLRGPDPEFRDPCRFALLDAYPDRAAHEWLCLLIEKVIPFPLTDLTPDTFADTMSANPEQTLEVYVELVDRCWALGKLLKLAVDDRPTDKLQRVYTSHSRWEKCLTNVLQ